MQKQKCPDGRKSSKSSMINKIYYKLGEVLAYIIVSCNSPTSGFVIYFIFIFWGEGQNHLESCGTLWILSKSLIFWKLIDSFNLVEPSLSKSFGILHLVEPCRCCQFCEILWKLLDSFNLVECCGILRILSKLFVVLWNLVDSFISSMLRTLRWSHPHFCPDNCDDPGCYIL